MAMVAARPSGATKLLWRAILTLSALALIALAVVATMAIFDITHMYFNAGTFLLVSGMVGTPPLIGLGVAAFLVKDYWL